MLKYLRIAVTALSLTACVLILALWWRSYWTLDFVSRVNIGKIQTTIGSQSGSVYFAHFNAEIAYKGTGNPYTSHGWKLVSRETHEVPKCEFIWVHSPNSMSIVAPHWFLAIIVALIGLTVWLPLRFSLRSLLIATTLVAVGLGMIMELIQSAVLCTARQH